MPDPFGRRKDCEACTSMSDHCAKFVDTDTFATLAGQTITFANGDTLTVPDDTFAIARTVLGAQTDFNGDPIPANSNVIQFANGDLACLAEDRRTEVVCEGDDIIINEIDAKTGNVVSSKCISSDFERVSMNHGTLPFQTEPDADYITIGSTTFPNNSAKPKLYNVIETSAVSGQAIDPTTGRLGVTSRLVVNGTNQIPKTGVADSYLTNVDEQSDNQYIAAYLFTVPPGGATVEWQKRITDVTNTNARWSNSGIIAISSRLVCE